jgi:hypothetical protein
MCKRLTRPAIVGSLRVEGGSVAIKKIIEHVLQTDQSSKHALVKLDPLNLVVSLVKDDIVQGAVNRVECVQVVFFDERRDHQPNVIRKIE